MQRDVLTALDAALAYFRPSEHSRNASSIILTAGKMREHLAAIEAELALRANTDPSLERVKAMRLATLLGDAEPTLSRQGDEITLSCPDGTITDEIYEALEAACCPRADRALPVPNKGAERC